MPTSQPEFVLHPRLHADTIPLGDWPLCRLLRMNDAQYPWFILVPRRPAICEVHELDRDDRIQLWSESDTLSRWLKTEYAADKLNIAALGNMVPQLHIHHIARFTDDASWPAPIWGRCTPVALDAEQLQDMRQRMARLKGLAQPPPRR